MEDLGLGAGGGGKVHGKIPVWTETFLSKEVLKKLPWALLAWSCETPVYRRISVDMSLAQEVARWNRPSQNLSPLYGLPAMQCSLPPKTPPRCPLGSQGRPDPLKKAEGAPTLHSVASSDE